MANRRFMFAYEANNVVNPRVMWTTLKNFGIDKMIVVNTSGQQYQQLEGVSVANEYHQVFNAEDENGKLYSDYKLIFLKPPESIPGNPQYKGFSKEEFDFTWLKDFKHPDGDVLYLIGPDQYTLPLDMVDMYKEDNQFVSLEITRNSLWSIVAAGIVARDAMIQDKYGK